MSDEVVVSRHARAAAARSRRNRAVVAGAAAAGLLLAGGAYAILGGEDDDTTATACGGDTLDVAVAPELAPTVASALERVTATDPCARFLVEPVVSVDAAAAINAGQGPDVWIPDSSTWLDAVDPAKSGGPWLEGPSIATSPVALAVGADRPAASGIPSWSNLLNTEGTVQMANPDVDTASRLAFHASRIGQPDRIGLRTGARLITLSRFAKPSVEELFAQHLEDPKGAQPFPASEQAVAAWNSEHGDASPLRAVLADKGTLSFDYPWITSPALSGASAGHADLARRELGSPDVRRALADAGFRGADGSGQAAPAAGTTGPLVALKALSREERLEAVEQWDVLRTDLRMLAVIDVSGSMLWPSTTPGMSRYDVTKGALKKGVSIIPAGSEVGGWLFSTDQGKGKDYRELAPIRRLDAKVGNETHRQVLARLVESSEKHVEGDTGLYDSVWAAYQHMQDSYDGTFVNSVVVMTDGENDDPNGGLSLDDLLDKLDAAYDAERPVRIITIGMGEASPTALQQIADETGGNSHIAETPDDIERVFVQALLARHS